MTIRALVICIAMVATWPAAAQIRPDETGMIFTCKVPSFPGLKLDMTNGREALIVNGKSYTFHIGSGYWSAGPYTTVPRRSGPNSPIINLTIWDDKRVTGNHPAKGICRARK